MERQPHHVEPIPRWPAWYAATGFLVGLIGTLIAVSLVAAITGTDSGDESASFTIGATLAQSLIFVATAVLFASFTLPPKAWHFGLRRTPFWRAVGWTVAAVVVFYVFAAIYGAIVQPDVEQGVTDKLGADEGTAGLIIAGLMVICVAPVAEEFFFRGFFYRALRSRFAIPVAATIDGLVFGIIHWDFSDPDLLLIVPVLAVLGALFCLLYEWTGSLYPAIALHALNNTIAYGVQADAWEVSAVVGPLMLAACALIPGIAHRAERQTAFP